MALETEFPYQIVDFEMVEKIHPLPPVNIFPIFPLFPTPEYQMFMNGIRQSIRESYYRTFKSHKQEIIKILGFRQIAIETGFKDNYIWANKPGVMMWSMARGREFLNRITDQLDLRTSPDSLKPWWMNQPKYYQNYALSCFQALKGIRPWNKVDFPPIIEPSLDFFNDIVL